eukprot:374067_1
MALFIKSTNKDTQFNKSMNRNHVRLQMTETHPTTFHHHIKSSHPRRWVSGGECLLPIPIPSNRRMKRNMTHLNPHQKRTNCKAEPKNWSKLSDPQVVKHDFASKLVRNSKGVDSLCTTDIDSKGVACAKYDAQRSQKASTSPANDREIVLSKKSPENDCGIGNNYHHHKAFDFQSTPFNNTRQTATDVDPLSRSRIRQPEPGITEDYVDEQVMLFLGDNQWEYGVDEEDDMDEEMAEMNEEDTDEDMDQFITDHAVKGRVRVSEITLE